MRKDSRDTLQTRVSSSCFIIEILHTLQRVFPGGVADEKTAEASLKPLAS